MTSRLITINISAKIRNLELSNAIFEEAGRSPWDALEVEWPDPEDADKDLFWPLEVIILEKKNKIDSTNQLLKSSNLTNKNCWNKTNYKL